MNYSALYHLISQAYIIKTKLLKEYLRLRKRPRFETGVTSFVRHKSLATFALFPVIFQHRPTSTQRSSRWLFISYIIAKKSVIMSEAFLVDVSIISKFIPCIRIRIWPVLGLCVQYIRLISAAHDLTPWLARRTLEPADHGRFLCGHLLYTFSSSFSAYNAQLLPTGYMNWYKW